MKKILSFLLVGILLVILTSCESPTSSGSETQSFSAESTDDRVADKEKDPLRVFRTYSFDWSFERSNHVWKKTVEYLYADGNNTQMGLNNGYRDYLRLANDAGDTTVWIDFGEHGMIANVIYYTYNSDGRLIDETYQNGDYVHYSDNGSKTESLLDGILREYSYDTAGNLVTEKITQNGRIIVFEYTNNGEGKVTETDLFIDGEPRGCFMTCEYNADGTYSEYYYRSVMPWYNMGTFDVKNRVTVNAELYDAPCVRVDYRSDGKADSVTLLDDGSTAEYVYCEYGDPAETLLTEVNVSGRDNVRIIKEYNEDGKILRSASQITDVNGVTSETVDYINEYDEEGHLLLKTLPTYVEPTVGDLIYYELSDGQGKRICLLDDVSRFDMEDRGMTEEEVKSRILDAFHEKYPETKEFGINDIYWGEVRYGYVDLAGGCDAYHAAFVIPGVENVQCCCGSAIVDTASNIVCFDDDPMFEIYNEYLYRTYKN